MKHPVRWAILAVVALIVLLFGSWLGSVMLSPVFGAGNAVKKVMSSDNMLGQYDHFMALDKDIRSQSEAAQQAQSTLDLFNKTYPPSSTESFQVTQQRSNLQADVSGPQQLCLQNVNKYDNDAKALTSTLFKDNRLPESFDPASCTNPAKLPPSINQ